MTYKKEKLLFKGQHKYKIKTVVFLNLNEN